MNGILEIQILPKTSKVIIQRFEPNENGGETHQDEADMKNQLRT